MAKYPPTVSGRAARERARQPLNYELERQIKSSHLPRTLEDAVFAQFSKSGDRSGRKCSLFGITTLYAFDAAGAAEWHLALPLAAAVEFAAAAASVLDDIQDLDPVKGIDPAVPGAAAELLTLLLMLSERAIDSLDGNAIPMQRIEASRGLTNRFELRALAGQHQANSRSGTARQGISDALEATDAKSGSFGRLAAETGAALATDDTCLIARLGEFGRHLAIVDQLQNDVAAVWPNGEESTDLRLGRATPPISFVLQLSTGVSASAAGAKAAISDYEDMDESSTREALFESGALHFAWVMAGIHYNKARRIAREEQAPDHGSRLEDLLRP